MSTKVKYMEDGSHELLAKKLERIDQRKSKALERTLCKSMPNAVEHEWWVFSTCLETCELMLICTKTDAFGVVPEPTAAEWKKAYWAPKYPYRWPESEQGRAVVKWPTGAHTLCHTEETKRLALMQTCDLPPR